MDVIIPTLEDDTTIEVTTIKIFPLYRTYVRINIYTFGV
jgi:hypothetical protein